MFSIKVLISFIIKCDKCYYNVRQGKIVNNGIIITSLLNDLDEVVYVIAILYLFGKNSALFLLFFSFSLFFFLIVFFSSISFIFISCCF